MDLTTLEAKDTPGKVRQLCAKAIRPHEALPDLPSAAAVCVYPPMVRIAKEALGDSGVKVAAVATAFPSGMSTRKVKLEETKYAVNEGADEIDMVISRGHFLAGEYLSLIHISFRMNNTFSGGHPLHISCLQVTGVSHAIVMKYLSFKK